MRKIFFILLLLLGESLSAQSTQGTLLSTWSDSSIPGSSAYNNTYNEIWGYAAGGFEYAIIGTTFGTHIIAVTDPTSITELFAIPGSQQGPAIVHRDYHDYKGYLYTLSDEVSGNHLQIIDMNRLPENAELVYDSGELIERAHNIFIDSSSARLYAWIGRGGDGMNNFDPMRIYDITDPVNPVFLKAYNTIEGRSFSQVHDGWVGNDTAFLNLGPSGMMIVDFSDIDNPKNLSFLGPSDYPQSGYNHSGWPNESGDYYYFSDEDWGKDVKVLDTRDIEDASVVSVFDAGNTSQFSIPHNQVVHDDLLYISYYYDGLQVYDLSKPDSPRQVMYYPSSQIPARGTYEGAWGVYPFLPSGNILVSDMQEGLFVVEKYESTVATQNLIDELDVVISPNPSSGLVKIQRSIALDQEIVVSIMSPVGQKLVQRTMNPGKSNIDFSAIDLRGLYYLLIEADGKKSLKKVIFTD